MKEVVLKLLEKKRYKEMRTLLLDMYPVDIAEALDNVDYKELIIIYRFLPKDIAAETFTHMNSDMQEVLINAFTDREIKEVLDEMYLDDTVDMIEEMPANVVDRILMVTDIQTRDQINSLLNYPEDSAGSMMTVEYVSLDKEMTVKNAIDKIRHVGISRETIYTCYVLEYRRLVGYVDVKDLLTSSDSKLIQDIMELDTICVDTHEDQEDVMKMFEKYSLMAVPVVDKTMCMVGIVTIDDAIVVQQEEGTEDIARMAAVYPSDETYFGTSVFQHVKNRSAWLLVLMLSSTITGILITRYESALATMTVISAFIPMIMGTGGNSGSQSATLIIRGLSVDEIKFDDIFRIIWKEFRVSIIVGCVLGVANGIRVLLMYQDAKLAFAIGVTLVATIILAKFVGCVLPLIAKKIKLDPALMAAPLITTLVDAGSIWVYFMVVTRVFGL